MPEHESITSPADLHHSLAPLIDANGNEAVKVSAIASAVNELTVTNAAAGNSPSIAATGDDANLDLLLVSKGTGKVKANGLEVVNVSGAQTLTNKTISGATNSLSNINLATQVVGNLPVSNLNGGTNASASTFWRGDGTWAVPAGGGGGASSPLTLTAGSTSETPLKLVLASGTPTANPFEVNSNAGSAGDIASIDVNGSYISRSKAANSKIGWADAGGSNFGGWEQNTVTSYWFKVYNALAIVVSNTVISFYNDVNIQGNYLQMNEMTEPAGVANGIRQFAKDNGSGKTQYCIKFGTGSAVVVATEA